MKKIKAIIDEVANTDITVLIKGESGTGKELIAHAIHLNSDRRDKPFVKVNCAVIPKGLLESELFGFEKGAFTGAHIKKPGKFELANGGTILLNDIGELDISIQGKLLQVLQDGIFSRLGGEGDLKVDTRVIATTRDHLERSMKAGQFREDLFYRINVINITIPPLKERKEQILPLSQYFLNIYQKKYGKEVQPPSSKLIHALQEYSWPGNIRELENMMKRMVLFGDGNEILEKLSDENARREEIHPVPYNPLSTTLFKGKRFLTLKEAGKRAAEEAEREMILNALQESHWNRKKAAKLLHVSYKALLYKIQKYQLNK